MGSKRPRASRTAHLGQASLRKDSVIGPEPSLETLSRRPPDTANCNTCGPAACRAPPSSSSDSSSENTGAASDRQRGLRRRGRGQLRRFLQEPPDPQLSLLTLLEREAASLTTTRSYVKELTAFTTWLRFPSISGLSGALVDESMCRYMESLYLAGKRPARGCRLWAAVLHARPEFGRMRPLALPRASRSLKG